MSKPSSSRHWQAAKGVLDLAGPPTTASPLALAAAGLEAYCEAQTTPADIDTAGGSTTPTTAVP